MEKTIFEAAWQFDFDAVRTYVENGKDLNVCDHRGYSLLTCFIMGYYSLGCLTPEEEKLLELHDECDYDFWDAYVYQYQKQPLEERPDDFLKKLEFLFAHGADPNLCVMEEYGTETALMQSVCWKDYYLTKYLLEHGANPGVWLFPKRDDQQSDREYWLMDELDIAIMNGAKGEAAINILRVAQLLWEYGLRDWGGYCIELDKAGGVTGGHPAGVLY